MSETFYTETDFEGHGEFVEGTVSLGVTATCDTAMEAVGWWFPAVAPSGPVKARVYSPAGTLLASVDAFDTTTLDAPNIATLPDPLPAGTYRVCIVTPNRYVAKASFFAGGSITRGGITLGPSYFGSGDAFPNTVSGNSATYYMEPVVTGGETEPEEHDGSAALGITITIAAAGHKVASGSAALTLDLAAATTPAGRKSARGSSALRVGLHVIPGGSKRGMGAASLGLGIRLATAHLRFRPGRLTAGGRATVRIVATGRPTSSLTAGSAE